MRRILARHAEAVAKAASERREYERQLATNAAQMAAYKIQAAKAGGRRRTHLPDDQRYSCHQGGTYGILDGPKSPSDLGNSVQGSYVLQSRPLDLLGYIPPDGDT